MIFSRASGLELRDRVLVEGVAEENTKDNATMRIYIIALGISLSVAPAIAQTSPANPSSTTPAVSTPNTTNPQAPVPGANSFTEGQAKSRIESNGYSGVSGLSQDAQGVWRGKAMKDGKSMEVTVDFQGNVVSR